MVWFWLPLYSTECSDANRRKDKRMAELYGTSEIIMQMNKSTKVPTNRVQRIFNDYCDKAAFRCMCWSVFYRESQMDLCEEKIA